MSKFFRIYTESHEGLEGKFYCEVQNGFIVRQVNVFDDRYYWATPEHCNNEQYDFTDRPEFSEPNQWATRISQEEFESVWRIATRT